MAWRALYLYAADAAARAKTGASKTTQLKRFQATLERLGSLELRDSVEDRRLQTLSEPETLNGRLWWHAEMPGLAVGKTLASSQQAQKSVLRSSIAARSAHSSQDSPPS